MGVRKWLAAAMLVGASAPLLSGCASSEAEAQAPDTFAGEWAASPQTEQTLGVARWRVSSTRDTEDVSVEGFGPAGPRLRLHAYRDGNTWVMEGEGEVARQKTVAYRAVVHRDGTKTGSIPAKIVLALSASLHDARRATAERTNKSLTVLWPRDTTSAPPAERGESALLQPSAETCLVNDATSKILSQTKALWSVCYGTDGSIVPEALCGEQFERTPIGTPSGTWREVNGLLDLVNSISPPGSTCDNVLKNLFESKKVDELRCTLLTTPEAATANQSMEAEPSMTADLPYQCPSGLGSARVTLSFSSACSEVQRAELRSQHCAAVSAAMSGLLRARAAKEGRGWEGESASDTQAWFNLWFYHTRATTPIDANDATAVADRMSATHEGLLRPAKYACLSNASALCATGGAAAYVDPASFSSTINVCPAYFTATTPSERIRLTILHENTHVWTDAADRGYGDFSGYRGYCGDTIILSTAMLLENADTLAGYSGLPSYEYLHGSRSSIDPAGLASSK